MHKSFVVAAVAILLPVFGLSTGTSTSSQQTTRAEPHSTARQASRTWSYKVAHVDNYEMEKGLNTLGKDGWEMVAPLKPNSYSYEGTQHEGYMFIFKKPQG